jgi:hypothetical protein
MPEIHYRLTFPPITGHSSARDIVKLLVPKHDLDHPDIDLLFQQMRGKAVPLIPTSELALLERRNLFDIARSLQIVNKRTQSKQIVSSKPGMSPGGLREQIWLRDIGPGCQDRAQTLVCVEIRHAIFTPVLLATYQDKAISTCWVEWMGNLEPPVGASALNFREYSVCSFSHLSWKIIPFEVPAH